MAKYIFTRPNGPWQYPTLGFTATVNDVIEANAAPDLWWELTDPGATVTLPAIPAIPGVVEPADGAVGIWNRQTNEVEFVEKVPDENLPDRLQDEALANTIVSLIETTVPPITGIVSVYAGSNLATARPDAPQVLWLLDDGYETATPVNFQVGDLTAKATGVPIEPTVAWLHAYLSSSVSGAGAKASWEDSAGALDLAQATGSRQPVFVPAAGAVPAHFDFNRESTSTGDSFYTAATNIPQPGCIVSAFRLDSLPENNSNNNTRRRIWGGIDTVNAWTFAVGHNGTNPEWRLAIGSDLAVGGVATTGWHLAIATFYANECELRIDGGAVSLSATITNTTYAGGFTVGSNAAMTSELFDGGIERLLVADEIPTNILAYESYMMALIAGWE